MKNLNWKFWRWPRQIRELKALNEQRRLEIERLMAREKVRHQFKRLRL